jgi:hypothetical protein
MTLRDERECFVSKLLDWGKSNHKVLNIIITYSPTKSGVISAVEIIPITPDSTSIRVIPGVNDIKVSMVAERARGYLKEELEEILALISELRKMYTQCLREAG